MIENKIAYYNFEIIDEYISGLLLNGLEVKSLKENKVNFSKNSFCYFNSNNKLVIKGLYFSRPGNIHPLIKFEEEREISLLLNKNEISKIRKKIEEKGFSLVPISLFRKNNFFKLKIGVGKGKKNYDKRESLKEKDIARETFKELKNKG